MPRRSAISHWFRMVWYAPGVLMRGVVAAFVGLLVFAFVVRLLTPCLARMVNTESWPGQVMLCALTWIPAMLIGAIESRRTAVRALKDMGCCRRCGYDLHGLTNPRCPECGTPFGGE